MKVNVDQTVEVSDEARKQIAEHLGQKTATRDDLKSFLWEHGAKWEAVLNGDRGVDTEAVVDGEPWSEDPTNINGVADLDDLLAASDDDEDLI